MPHVVVKLWPGKTDAQKAELTEAIVEDVTRVLECSKDGVSVGFEETPSENWTEQVFEPDILDKWSSLTKQPGYGPRPDNAD